jgi:hypothetical protein
MKALLTILPVSILCVSCIVPLNQQVFLNSTQPIHTDTPRTALYIQLDTITSEYLDNTTILPEIELSDSFYCDAANNLILYEGTKRFTIKTFAEIAQRDSLVRWSSFYGDTAGKGIVSENISKLIRNSGSEYALVAFACSLKHCVTSHNGWRNGKYGGTYTQPLTYTSRAMIHVQVWDKEGVLLYENKATGNSGRPILYDTIKKSVRKSDVISYSKNPFSPPLLRALNQAARGSMSFQF